MENESGAMSRVVGLFSARDYNIDSLAVAPTEDKTLSRMTIVTHGDEQVIEQITKQLNKLIEVIKVVDLNESRFVERELMLVKVRAVGKDRDEFLRLTEIYRGSIIDVTDRSYTIEITGSTDKLDSFLETVGRAQILETVRTGAAGIGAAIDDGLLDIPFRVLSFEAVFFDRMGNARPENSDGANFTENQRNLMRSLRRGQRFYVSRVVVVGPDGLRRTLPQPVEIIVN